LDGKNGPCDNKTHVATFDLVTLEPCLPIDSMFEIEIIDALKVSDDGESLATCLEIGDCFVVVAQGNTKDSVGFWVLMCVEGLHMVTKNIHVEAFHQEFLHGNQVLIGRYFNQQGKSSFYYVQCDKGETYIFSHLIRVVKFQMVQSFHKQKGGENLFSNFPRLLFLKYDL
jgi:hypothetical protein